MRFSALLLTLLLALPLAPASASSTEQHHTVIGWIEAIKISPTGEQVVQAKIDSGADNSSLHATEIEYIEKDQQTWVRFKTIQGISYETPLLKKTSIKMKDGNRQQRPVIVANLCIGNRLNEIRLNLVDRGHFKYPALIGRSAMSGYLIDPKNKHLAGHPDCGLTDNR
ncbi:ATP-dependent zinc protease [Thiomicrorhabdus sediminis]|uniref:ATP-dependent zinc protease n=1 Tax=Thiomicrorhabdus sediminis TaxID=2580412 RepID=A0A4P9K3L9_9GAMM|nr:RimK/LysX family protein [Thiomicrorhabdus sediminis]QCU89514.1 ATP-dependent zinc protease [Thiomicrorhabdus sediminis]